MKTHFRLLAVVAICSVSTTLPAQEPFPVTHEIRNGQYWLSWNALPGNAYVIESCHTLAEGGYAPWAPLPNGRLYATFGATELSAAVYTLPPPPDAPSEPPNTTTNVVSADITALTDGRNLVKFSTGSSTVITQDFSAFFPIYFGSFTTGNVTTRIDLYLNEGQNHLAASATGLNPTEEAQLGTLLAFLPQMLGQLHEPDSSPPPAAETNVAHLFRVRHLPNIDTDDDGLSDAQEMQDSHTNPFRADTDHDGQSDGAEVAAGRDPNLHEEMADIDGDGIISALERSVADEPDEPVIVGLAKDLWIYPHGHSHGGLDEDGSVPPRFFSSFGRTESFSKAITDFSEDYGFMAAEFHPSLGEVFQLKQSGQFWHEVEAPATGSVDWTSPYQSTSTLHPNANETQQTVAAGGTFTSDWHESLYYGPSVNQIQTTTTITRTGQPTETTQGTMGKFFEHTAITGSPNGVMRSATLTAPGTTHTITETLGGEITLDDLQSAAIDPANIQEKHDRRRAFTTDTSHTSTATKVVFNDEPFTAALLYQDTRWPGSWYEYADTKSLASVWRVKVPRFWQQAVTLVTLDAPWLAAEREVLDIASADIATAENYTPVQDQRASVPKQEAPQPTAQSGRLIVPMYFGEPQDAEDRYFHRGFDNLPRYTLEPNAGAETTEEFANVNLPQFPGQMQPEVMGLPWQMVAGGSGSAYRPQEAMASFFAGDNPEVIGKLNANLSSTNEGLAIVAEVHTVLNLSVGRVKLTPANSSVSLPQSQDRLLLRQADEEKKPVLNLQVLPRREITLHVWRITHQAIDEQGVPVGPAVNRRYLTQSPYDTEQHLELYLNGVYGRQMNVFFEVTVSDVITSCEVPPAPDPGYDSIPDWLQQGTNQRPTDLNGTNGALDFIAPVPTNYIAWRNNPTHQMARYSSEERNLLTNHFAEGVDINVYLLPIAMRGWDLKAKTGIVTGYCKAWQLDNENIKPYCLVSGSILSDLQHFQTIAHEIGHTGLLLHPRVTKNNKYIPVPRGFPLAGMGNDPIARDQHRLMWGLMPSPTITAPEFLAESYDETEMPPARMIREEWLQFRNEWGEIQRRNGENQ